MAATRIATRIIDGDGHVMEDIEGIAGFLPPPYKGDRFFPRVAFFPPLDPMRHPHQILPGAFRQVGPDGWLEFLEDVGIDTAVLYPTWGLTYGRATNVDWAIALTTAYNDWLYQTYLKKSPRFKGMGLIPMQEPETAAAELRRVVEELGMCGAMLPSRGLKAHLGSKEYWPVYREADRLGCCLAVHGGIHAGLGMDDMNVHAVVHALGHPFGQAVNFGGIIFNGVLDRYPRVRFAFLEGGVAWLLLALERFDRSHETHVHYNPRGELLNLRANERVSDYIIRHIKAGRLFVGCEGSEPALTYAVKVVGSEPFLYSSDFPHEVNNEMCKSEIAEIRESGELTIADKEAILHGNAERFYNLPP